LKCKLAGGDQLFEAELVEVGGEVLEEIALERIIAVAIDHLVAEGVGIKVQVSLDLLLDVDVLRVELVLLGRPCCAEALIHRPSLGRAAGVTGFFRCHVLFVKTADGAVAATRQLANVNGRLVTQNSNPDDFAHQSLVLIHEPPGVSRRPVGLSQTGLV
jgi:hypothetical protein